MAQANAFDLLADYDTDDTSLILAAHLKAATATKPSPPRSPERRIKTVVPKLATQPKAAAAPVKPPPEPARQVEEVRTSGEFDDNESFRVLASLCPRKFGVGDEVKVQKMAGGRGGGRSYGGGEARHSCRSTSSRYGRPVRTNIVAAADDYEDYGLKVTTKRRLSDRLGVCGWGNVIRKKGIGSLNCGEMGDVELEERPSELPSSYDAYGMIEEQPPRNVPDNESEDERMTLDEYEKMRAEKKKALTAMLAAKQDSGAVSIERDFEEESATSTDEEEELSRRRITQDEHEKIMAEEKQALTAMLSVKQEIEAVFIEKDFKQESANSTDEEEELSEGDMNLEEYGKIVAEEKKALSAMLSADLDLDAVFIEKDFEMELANSTYEDEEEELSDGFVILHAGRDY